MSLIAAVNHRQMRCLEFSAPRHRHRLNALTQVAIIGDLFADNAHLFQQLDGSLEHLLPFVQLVLVRHLLVSQQFQPFLIRARQLTEKRSFAYIIANLVVSMDLDSPQGRQTGHAGPPIEIHVNAFLQPPELK